MKKKFQIFGLMAVITVMVSACSSNIKTVDHVFVSNGTTITKLHFEWQRGISGYLLSGEPVYVDHGEIMLTEHQRPVSDIVECPGFFIEPIRRNNLSYQAIYIVNQKEVNRNGVLTMEKEAEEVKSLYLVTWNEVIHYYIEDGLLKSKELSAKDIAHLPKSAVKAFRDSQGFYVI